MMTPTRRPRTGTSWFITAAAARQPVGSTTIFMRSAKKRICERSWASLTVTISRTSRCMMGKVRLPTQGVCAPSAMVRGTGMRTMRPLRSVAGLGLDPIDLAAWRQLLRREGAAREQPAAAHADEQEIQWPGLFQQFLGHGALPRDHVGIVERHHESRAALGDDASGDRLAILAFPVVRDDARAVALGGRPLDRRRIARHPDGRAHAQEVSGQGHGLRMIARGESHRAARSLLGREAAQRVIGTAELEGACALEILTFEEDLRTGQLVGLS